MALDNRKLRTLLIQQCGLLVLISSLASSIKFGLISPIEVVEEWGCQDSEIRLTCSNLDSTIAILEATFKPNCSMSGRADNSSNNNINGSDAHSDNCVQIDLKRLTPPKHDPIYDETIAGRRFLEALRQHHKEREERNKPTVQSVKTASFNFGITPKDAKADDDNELKRKRMTLRASLEELLVEYLNLRSLASDGDGLSDDRSRVKRSTNSLNRFRRNDQNENTDTENLNNSNEENRVQNKQSAKIRLEHIDTDDNGNVTSTNATKSVCPQRRQRITQLDRNELAIALQSDSEHEHNIRRLLNYRCSGKNHCRVVFNEHHPFSVLWPYGTVHIKYICMERYRMNKFCGEHLKVTNESPEPELELSLHQRSVTNENDIQNDDSGTHQLGPKAEALIQNEQMFHHLKILKPSPSEMENERRKSVAMAEKLEKTANKKGVYSQDFRAMKVLPANLDDINDIEKIGDEFYFKKEEDVDNDNIDDDIINREHLQHTKAIVKTTEPTVHTSRRQPIENDDDGKNIIEHGFDSSNNGLRDVRSTLGYDEMHNRKYHSSIQPIVQTKPTAETVTHTQQHEQHQFPATVNLWNNEMLPPNTGIFETRPDDIDVSYDIFGMSENQTKSQLDAKIVRAKNDFTILKTDRADMDREMESDEDYDSYEDYEVEIDGPKVWRKNKVRTHLSYQKTGLLLRPLQQGFIASPGYPAYYIGNSNCSWRITVDSGQPIRLVLLDVSLRYDPVCKDYLQIIDVGSKIILHQNCTEIDRPVEIISHSNEVNIALKTVSTLAYPKRGILIYYAALGCIVPSPPKYGRLVSQTEDSIKFQCNPSFLFPDTFLSSRTLHCTDRNTWDNSLPDCVEQTSVKIKKEDPFITQLWKQTRLGGRNVDQADMLYDILIPVILIVGLLVVNGFIVLVIWRYRKKRKDEPDSDQLARL